MDIKEQYDDLTRKLKESVPFTAFPLRTLVQSLRIKGQPITLKTKLTIKDVYNSGDITGIVCSTEQIGDNVLACALTQLIVSHNHPLYKEIKDYQKKRNKRILKLNHK